MPLQYGINEEGKYESYPASMAVSENTITVGASLNSVSTPTKTLNSFSGLISDVNIITDALNSKQIFNLYLKNKDVFQRELDGIQSIISPELSESECIELAKEMGLYDEVNESEIYTLICEFPFDVVIPINSRILWLETLSLENGPYHSIRSVDNIFSTGSVTSADMGFYDGTFTDGVYEYHDDLNNSLTGKIIISKPTNDIGINEGTASPQCADNYSCYDTFAAEIVVGEKVTWKNLDTWDHTVTSGNPVDGPDGLFDSGIIDTFNYFSHTFNKAGTYDYYCTDHPWKHGKIVVGEG